MCACCVPQEASECASSVCNTATHRCQGIANGGNCTSTSQCDVDSFCDSNSQCTPRPLPGVRAYIAIYAALTCFCLTIVLRSVRHAATVRLSQALRSWNRVPNDRAGHHRWVRMAAPTDDVWFDSLWATSTGVCTKFYSLPVGAELATSDFPELCSTSRVVPASGSQYSTCRGPLNRDLFYKPCDVASSATYPGFQCICPLGGGTPVLLPVDFVHPAEQGRVGDAWNHAVAAGWPLNFADSTHTCARMPSNAWSITGALSTMRSSRTRRTLALVPTFTAPRRLCTCLVPARQSAGGLIVMWVHPASFLAPMVARR